MTIRSQLRGLGLAAALVGPLGCGAPAVTSPPATSGPASLAPTSPATPAPVESSPVAETAPPASTGAMVDPGLLEVLPAEIDGASLLPDPVTASQIAADPFVSQTALGVAVAIVVAPGSSDSEDVAVASVVRLKPDVFDETFYQEWRDGYNDAACAVAGGIEADEEQELAGRNVYVSTCTGGTQAYHTFLEDQGFIVSVTSTGPRAFGEQIMAGLAS